MAGAKAELCYEPVRRLLQTWSGRDLKGRAGYAANVVPSAVGDNFRRTRATEELASSSALIAAPDHSPELKSASR